MAEISVFGEIVAKTADGITSRTSHIYDDAENKMQSEVNEELKTSIESKLDDAPNDGKTYGRNAGAWVEIAGGGASSAENVSYTHNEQTNVEGALDDLYAKSGDGDITIVDLVDYVDAFNGIVSIPFSGMSIEVPVSIPRGEKFGQPVPMDYDKHKYVFTFNIDGIPSNMIRTEVHIANISGRIDILGFTIWLYFLSDKMPLLHLDVTTNNDDRWVFHSWHTPDDNYYFGNLSLNNDGNLTDAPYYRDGQSNDKTYARKDGKWVSIDKAYLTKDDLEETEGEYILDLTLYDCDVYLDWSTESDPLIVYGTDTGSGNWVYTHEATIIMSGNNIVVSDAAYLVGQDVTNADGVYIGVYADNTVVYGERTSIV